MVIEWGDAAVKICACFCCATAGRGIFSGKAPLLAYVALRTCVFPMFSLGPLLSRNLEVKLHSSRVWFLLCDSAMCWGSVSVKQPSAS